METLYFTKLKEIRKERKLLEEKLKVEITIKGRNVSFSGTAIQEYEASTVLEAMQFGFSAQKALVLLEPDMQFKKLRIKDFTRRTNLKDVRARVIGKEGKTKRTLESISDSLICIQKNEVGIIASAEAIEETLTAIKNLIRGSKEANTYSFLERMNTERKKHESDLGLKFKEKE